MPTGAPAASPVLVLPALVTAGRGGALYTLVCGVPEPEPAPTRAAFARMFRSFRFGEGCGPGS